MFSDPCVEQSRQKEIHMPVGESLCLKVKSFMIQPLLGQMPKEVAPVGGNNK